MKILYRKVSVTLGAVLTCLMISSFGVVRRGTLAGHVTLC